MPEMARCSIGGFYKRFSLFKHEGELRKLLLVVLRLIVLMVINITFGIS